MDVDTSLNIVSTYNIFLSSANRTEGTSSSFAVNLIRPIILGNPNNWLTCRVGSAEIPYNFKLLNPSNNSITYQFIRNAVTYNGTITIEPGNYNILSLLSEFKSKLIVSILSIAGYDGSSIFNFTYNRNTGKATFSMVGTDSIISSLTILSASLVFYRCIGFTNGFTFGYTTPSTRTDTTSTQNVNVSQNTALYIRSENLSQTSNYENVVSQAEYSDILAKVQVNVLPGSIIQWTNSTDLEVDITNKTIDRINLYLGDSNLYEIDMGNLDWTCRLTIQEWSYKTDSHAKDRLPVDTIDPTVYDNLLKTREKNIKRLQRLKSRVLAEDATKEGTGLYPQG